jgi:hypothetical protein
MGNLVRKMPMVGKKGDRIHIPKPVRGSANAKVEATAVNIQANTATELLVDIDRHFEYSILIEDITEKQALTSMRRFYTDDAGYALATQIDSDLFALGTGLGDGGAYVIANAPSDWEHSACFYFDSGSSGALTAYAEDTVVAADVFTDVGFRKAIQNLDDSDVPMDQRVLMIPPSAKNTVTGIERYVSNDFRDNRTVQNGLIGEIYGIPVYISTNTPVIETSAQNGASGTAEVKGCFLFHRDAFVFAEQMGVRTQTQYKQEYLADLFTADTLYGIQVYRPEAGIVMAVPNV